MITDETNNNSESVHEGQRKEEILVPHLVVLGIALIVLVALHLPFIRLLAKKHSYLMSFSYYVMLVGVFTVIQMVFLAIRKLRPYLMISSFLLLLLCGYAAAEVVYRVYPLSAKSLVDVLGRETVRHLNMLFLHRFYHLIPLTGMVLLYFSFPRNYFPRYLNFGDSSVMTTILDKNKPRTWKSIFTWYMLWVGGVFIFLVIYGFAKNGMRFTFPVSIIGAILLYSFWIGFTEEVLFRGILHSAFSRTLKPETANLLQAILFGLVHIDPYNLIISAVKIVIFTFLGWFFGRATRETGGILLPFFMHSVLELTIELQLILR